MISFRNEKRYALKIQGLSMRQQGCCVKYSPEILSRDARVPQASFNNAGLRVFGGKYTRFDSADQRAITYKRINTI